MTKKILTVVGTRPNFIKITQFDKEFTGHGDHFEHRLLHTGQHYDDNMSKIFFEQFKLKEPDYYLNIQGMSPTSQIGNIILELEKVLLDYQPDLIMVVGDVNSTAAAALSANKCGIKVAHVESGLRSYDREMPEEINRLVADQIADIFWITEPSGTKNLIAEGRSEDDMFYVGNTMIDTLVAFDDDIQRNDILERLGVESGEFALMTIHRPRNVDTKAKLEILLSIIKTITAKLKLVLPIHPRTANSLKKHGLYEHVENQDGLVLTEALDYLAFQKLVSTAKFVITDSGGIQEETTYRQVPCLTLRENTERPVTITEGTNELVEYNPNIVEEKISAVLNGTYKKGNIPKYWDGKATKRIVEYLKEIL